MVTSRSRDKSKQKMKQMPTQISTQIPQEHFEKSKIDEYADIFDELEKGKITWLNTWLSDTCLSRGLKTSSTFI